MYGCMGMGGCGCGRANGWVCFDMYVPRSTVSYRAVMCAFRSPTQLPRAASTQGRYRETGTVGPASQAPGTVASSEGLVGSGDLALLTI